MQFSYNSKQNEHFKEISCGHLGKKEKKQKNIVLQQKTFTIQ